MHKKSYHKFNLRYIGYILAYYGKYNDYHRITLIIILLEL